MSDTKKILFCLMLGLLCKASAQTITSSPLPIVFIDTGQDSIYGGYQEIPDEYKIMATMKILYIDDSTVNYVSDKETARCQNYNGRIGIERRGSTSQLLEKGHYGFETRNAAGSNNNVSLLGMPSENDWILNPMNFDDSYIRDCLSYAISNRIGLYASRTKYCELFINDEYQGVYFLAEKIKTDKGRVNIAKMKTSDNTFPNITGGYIIKADKQTGGDPVAWTTPEYGNIFEAVKYIYHIPKPSQITIEQGNYIHDYFVRFVDAMEQGNSSTEDGYPSLIDLPSFIDYMIIGELTSNVDIYQLSTFFHKDRRGKLRAGPVWDFNLAFGNDLPGGSRSRYNVWQFDNGDNNGSAFWYQLFHDTTYHRHLVKRWHELTSEEGILSYSNVAGIIDSLAEIISTGAARDQILWYGDYNYSHSNEIRRIKNWLRNRYYWITANIGSCADTEETSTPRLVISKINYAPRPKNTAFTPKELEFIAITNAEESTVDLTGMYLSELGLSYIFPPHATIEPHEELYLVSDSAAFTTYYGLRAHGEFSRNLSDTSQRIVLADAWGDVVDEVRYSNRAPWPVQGYNGETYIELDDLYSDNNRGENWHIGDIARMEISSGAENAEIHIYPNPAKDYIRIEGDGIKEIKIADIYGRIVAHIEPSGYSNTSDIRKYAAGTYFVTATTSSGTATRKIVKIK